jgi:hypothetical protein
MGLEQEEEDEAEARVVDVYPVPTLTVTTQTPQLEQPSKKAVSEPRVRSEVGSTSGVVVIWVEWYIVYHPTYRIPSLCFSAGWEGECRRGSREKRL